MTPLNTTAANVIGTSSRNENRAAESRSRPRKPPAVIVIPERETPGMSARLCARPTATPCFSVRSSIDLVIGRRSAQPSSPPKPARKIAICHGSPRWLGDHVLEREADQRRPGSSRRARPRRSLVARLDRPPASVPSQPTHERLQVVPEVRPDRDERAEVERDVERLVERVVLLEVVPLEEPRDEDQVPRRRDRQQLGGPLDEPEDERLPVRELRRIVPDGRGP